MVSRLRWLLIFAILCAHLLAAPAQTHACTGCIDSPPTPAEAFAASEVVFAGRVVRQQGEAGEIGWGVPGPSIFVKTDGSNRERLINEFEVTTIYKGPSVAKFVVKDSGCYHYFVLNNEYLVYTSESNGEMWGGRGPCSADKLLMSAQADLLVLGEGRAPPSEGVYPAPIPTFPDGFTIDNLPSLAMGGLTGLTSVSLWSTLWIYQLFEYLES